MKDTLNKYMKHFERSQSGTKQQQQNLNSQIGTIKQQIQYEKDLIRS